MRGMRVPFWQQPCAMNVPTRSHELIMVMGAQRSGTNVLFSSLATDRTLSAFPEDIDSAFYCNFLLRPLSELAALIERAPGRILLKPINETGRRSLAELAEEYRSYPLRFVWIYRDPVNVFDSMRRERWLAPNEIDQPAHIRGWRKHNEYALQFQQQCPEQIAIVRYEDLCFDRAVFRQLTRWLGLDCNSYFRKDTAQGRKHVGVVAQRNIDARTSDTLAALDAARTFSPRRALLLKRRIVTYLRESLTTHPTASEAGRAEADAHSQILKVAEPARPPSAVPGLHFWLNSAAICHRNGLLTTDVVEGGPYRMVAASSEARQRSVRAFEFALPRHAFLSAYQNGRTTAGRQWHALLWRRSRLEFFLRQQWLHRIRPFPTESSLLRTLQSTALYFVPCRSAEYCGSSVLPGMGRAHEQFERARCLISSAGPTANESDLDTTPITPKSGVGFDHRPTRRRRQRPIFDLGKRYSG